MLQAFAQHSCQQSQALLDCCYTRKVGKALKSVLGVSSDGEVWVVSPNIVMKLKGKGMSAGPMLAANVPGTSDGVSVLCLPGSRGHESIVCTSTELAK